MQILLTKAEYDELTERAEPNEKLRRSKNVCVDKLRLLYWMALSAHDKSVNIPPEYIIALIEPENFYQIHLEVLDITDERGIPDALEYAKDASEKYRKKINADTI